MIDRIFSLIPFIAGAIALTLLILTYKKVLVRKQIVKKKGLVEIVLEKVNASTSLKKIKDILSFKLFIITGKFSNKNDEYVIHIVASILILALIGTFYISRFTDIWYLFIITFIFFLGLPFFAFELYFEYKVKKRSLQVPAASEAISLGYGDTNTLVGGIREALPQMKKEVRAELERLSYSLEQGDPEESINEFISKTPDKWMKILGTIFLSYIKNGGDLTESLDFFNDNVAYYILYREKTKSQMFIPKGIILTIYALIPFAIYANTKMFPVARVIHFTDVKALKLLVYAIVSNTFSLIGVFILQRT
ncbi:hypothetical protein NE686_17290 [Tissierella carlieri]|uniref:Type II secretion system protein GspF domain-containing protein n=1 Tax=Tissierella carlieri TaxID=689904 RepID=A0ABT1SEE7_9FIRM|nr:hypothetical protein [Tissierella carlieri]MCQ4924860.1 hypothetical protein [Tissierella carlieri]